MVTIPSDSNSQGQFPLFSTLFHAGSNKKLYYVLRVPYSLETDSEDDFSDTEGDDFAPFVVLRSGLPMCAYFRRTRFAWYAYSSQL